MSRRWIRAGAARLDCKEKSHVRTMHFLEKIMVIAYGPTVSH